MRKIVLAFDSFKGSAGSLDIARCAAQAIRKACPDCEPVYFPIADGGEGTTEAICTQLETEKVSCRVHDPLMNPIEATYAITRDGKTAILEMAAASGLPLIPTAQRNPMQTTSYGTGEMIRDALNRGCRRFIMGLGGSATNDAGTGMMQALGVRFLDKEGKELETTGGQLVHIEHIDDDALHPALKESEFTIVCDVNNPFCGEQGAAHIFAPQKGATPDEVRALDEGLCHYATLLKKEKGTDITLTAGAGAAGGMGGGILPFLNATLKPGIDTLLEMLHFRECVRSADLIFTGEGKLDAQTCMGKAPGGILKCALEEGIPVVALGGCIEAVEVLNEMGFTAVLPIQPAPISLEQAMQPAFTLRNIERSVVQVLRLIKRFRS